MTYNGGLNGVILKSEWISVKQLSKKQRCRRKTHESRATCYGLENRDASRKYVLTVRKRKVFILKPSAKGSHSRGLMPWRMIDSHNYNPPGFPRVGLESARTEMIAFFTRRVIHTSRMFTVPCTNYLTFTSESSECAIKKKHTHSKYRKFFDNNPFS